PLSTLFPYTTLFRSALRPLPLLPRYPEHLRLVRSALPTRKLIPRGSHLQSESQRRLVAVTLFPRDRNQPHATDQYRWVWNRCLRSEEHTSELQSRFD